MKKFIAVILGFLMVCNAILLATYGNVSVSANSEFNKNPLDTLVEWGVVEQYRISEATQEMKVEEYFEILSRYFLLTNFSYTLLNKTNVEEQDILTMPIAEKLLCAMLNLDCDYSSDAAIYAALMPYLDKNYKRETLNANLSKVSNLLYALAHDFESEVNIVSKNYNNLVLRGKETQLTNVNIKGNLIIVCGPDRKVTLSNVKIGGSLIIVGQNPSIYINNSIIKNIDVSNYYDGNIKLNINSSEISNINVRTSLTISGDAKNIVVSGEDTWLNADGNYSSITVNSASHIRLLGGTTEEFSITTDDTELAVFKNSTIVNLNLDAQAFIVNYGEIIYSNVTAENSYFTKLPLYLHGDKQILENYGIDINKNQGSLSDEMTVSSIGSGTSINLSSPQGSAGQSNIPYIEETLADLELIFVIERQYSYSYWAGTWYYECLGHASFPHTSHVYCTAHNHEEISISSCSYTSTTCDCGPPAGYIYCAYHKNYHSIASIGPYCVYQSWLSGGNTLLSTSGGNELMAVPPITEHIKHYQCKIHGLVFYANPGSCPEACSGYSIACSCTPTYSYHNPSTSPCNNCYLVDNTYLVSGSFVKNTNKLETRIVEKFLAKQPDIQYKIGVADNTSSGIKQAPTLDAAAINNKLAQLKTTYGGETYGADLYNVTNPNLFSTNAKTKTVNYVYLYGDINQLKNQILNAYATKGIITNIISVYSGVDTNAQALIAAANAGKGSYFGLDYSQTTDNLDMAIENIIKLQLKAWALEKYIIGDTAAKVNLSYSDLYTGIESAEVEAWLTRAGTNLLTGNYIHQVADIGYKSDELTLQFVRTYNSLAGSKWSIVGNGFSTNFDTRIDAKANNMATVVSAYANAYSSVAATEVKQILSKGTQVTNVQQTGEYTKVTYNNQTLFILTSDLSVAAAYIVTLPTGTQITFLDNGEGGYSCLSKIDATLNVGSTEITYTEKSGLCYIYNKTNGKLKVIKDKFGNTITLTYNSYNQFTKATDNYGRSLTFTYNSTNAATGMLTSITDNSTPARTVSFQYSGKQLTRVTDLNGYPMYYTYGDNGLLSSIKDNNGNVILSNAYDLLGRIVRQYDAFNNLSYYIYDDEISGSGEIGTAARYYVDSLGEYSCVTYNSLLKPIEERDALGNTITYEYYYFDGLDWQDVTDLTKGSDELKAYENLLVSSGGQVPMRTEVTDQKGSKTISQSDEQGNIVSQTDANGFTTTYTYDEFNNLTSKTDALNNTEIYTYSSDGVLLLTVTDKLGRETAFEYYTNLAISNKLKSQTDSNGNITSYFYTDTWLNLTKVIDCNGAETIYQYDSIGRIIKKTTADGAITSYTYDKMGRLTKQVNNDGGEYIYAYDKAGNLISQKDANYNKTTNDNEIKYEYYKNGQLKAKTLGTKILESYIYDAKGNLIQITDADSVITKYKYDILGNRIQQIDSLGNIIIYVYDECRRLIQITDAELNSTYYEFDAAGNIIKETDALGYYTLYEYNALNKLISTTGKDGVVVEYQYDAIGREISRTERLGGQTQITYDDEFYTATQTLCNGATKVAISNALGQLIQTIDEQGNLTYYTYDNMGNCIEILHSNGLKETYSFNKMGLLIQATLTDTVTNQVRTISYTYDKVGNMITQTNAKGLVTTYKYDALNRQISVKNSLQGESLTEYSTAGRILSQTDSLNNKTTYSYDTAGRNYKITFADGSFKAFIYDKAGNVTEQKILNNTVISYEYDALYRIITQTDAAGYFTSLQYDAAGNNTVKTDARGNSTYYEYNAMGQVTKVTNPDGSTMLYEYDIMGNNIKITDGNGNVMLQVFDNLNRKITQIDALGNSTYYEYDTAGNIIKVTDALGNITLYTYDAFTNLLSVSQNTETTVYTYNSLNNLTSVTTPDDRTILMEYDTAGRLLAEGDEAGNYETYKYNTLDQLIKKTDRRGNVFDYTYSKTGRLIMEVTGSKAVTYSYDLIGNLLTVTDSNGVITYTYDERNLVVGINNYSVDNAIQYIRDGMGNKLSVTIDGQTVYYTYDNMNRIKTVTSNGLTSTYTYDANSNVSTVTTDGITVQFSYDERNFLIELINTINGTEIINTYLYNELGLQIYKCEAGVETLYTYDTLGRLLTVTEDDGTITAYQYDNGGNRTKQTVTLDGQVLKTVEYQYNVLNRLIQSTETVTVYEYDEEGNLIEDTALDSVITSIYTYDANGNQTKAEATTYTYDDDTSVDEVTQYGFDAYNRMISSTVDNQTIQYKYYASGMRYSNGESKYYYDGKNVLLEKVEATEENTASSRLNVYGITLVFTVVSDTEESQNLIYVYNGHADVIAVCSDEGVLLNIYLYDAFGNIIFKSETVINRYNYSGYEYDSKTGLYYLRSRYYDPITARFISRDTFSGFYNDPLSLNRYTYCHNNPVSYFDPDGYAIITITLSAAAVNWILVTIGVVGTAGILAATEPQTHLLQNAGRAIDEGIKKLGKVIGNAIDAAGTFIGNIFNKSNTKEKEKEKVIIIDKTTTDEKKQEYVTLYHYGTMSNAASYATGMKEDTFYTTNPFYSGPEAEKFLALNKVPDGIVEVKIPKVYYDQLVSNGSITEPTIISPKYGQPGGGVEIYSYTAFYNGVNEVIISPIIPIRQSQVNKTNFKETSILCAE